MNGKPCFIFIVFMAMFCRVYALDLDSAGSSPKIEFDSREFDLGEVSQSTDSIKSCDFEFVNSGTSDLVIINVATGCGCTRASYAKEPIAPQSKGSVKVTYNASRKRKGPFRKSITVFSNDPRRYVRFFIFGTVVD